MTKLSSHQSAEFFKTLYIGDSSKGKTGSLVSLVKAGHRLRILDLDNGLDILRQYILKECPDKIDLVDFITIRDTYRASNAGPIVDAKAFVESTRLMTKWDDGSIPADDGPNSFFVVDSGTTLGKAGFEWAKSLNPGSKDPRQWYFAAQQAYENLIAMLTSHAFKTNLIFITHINYKELEDGTTKGYPSAVGSALGPIIPKYFNSLFIADTIGTGKNLKRVILTRPTGLVDAKNSAPFRLAPEYDLSTGLAEIVATLKEAPGVQK